MKSSAPIRIALLTSVLAAASTGCNTALIPEGIMNTLGAQTYAEETGKHKVLTGSAEARMLEDVGRKIAAATGKNYEWEFKLLDAPGVVNAFCLPGGKIAFYTGILPIARDDKGDLTNGVAAIMGHEIAHAILEHGNKRMTSGIGVKVSLAIIQAALSNWGEVSDSTKADIMKGLGMGAQYGIVLPFSRDHESEADIEGIRYAIRAGYDPYEAPKLWERMATKYPNSQPAFMSTHPPSMERAAALRAAIPQLIEQERKR